MRKYLLLLFFLISVISLPAQSQKIKSHARDSTDYGCSQEDLIRDIVKNNPSLKKKIDEANKRLEEETSQFQNRKTKKNTVNARLNPNGITIEEDVKIIPIVFHVIHGGGQENISDAQIIESVQQINEDFRATNPEIGNTFQASKHLITDVGIEFRLAELDPDGNLTTGITRHYNASWTSNGEGYQGDIKRFRQWDPSKYLNVWVVYSSNGNNGSAYAHYPATVDADTATIWDGVVSSHWAIGRTGTAASTHIKILTHEIGHWANLKHVWGDQTTYGTAAACGDDDHVFDTPNTKGNTGAPVDGTSTCGYTDNVQNFMDYSTAPTMFTTGQKARMRAALNSNVARRNNIWTEENLRATLIYDRRHLVYDNALFESEENDGSINPIPLEVRNETFSKESGSFTNGNDFKVEGLAEGLDLRIDLTSDTTAVLNFIGSALDHRTIKNISKSIKLEFFDNMFTQGDASTVIGANRDNLSLTFRNPYRVVYKASDDIRALNKANEFLFFSLGFGSADYGLWMYYEDHNKLETYGKPVICHPGTRNILPLKLGDVVNEQATFELPGDYPDQLDLTSRQYFDWLGKTAYVGVKFTNEAYGKEETHYGWIQLSYQGNTALQVLDWAYNETPNEEITVGQTKGKGKSILYSKLDFIESSYANDGSIEETSKIELTEVEFSRMGDLSEGTDYVVNNLPTGLELKITAINKQEASFYFTGKASVHDKTSDTETLSLEFKDAAFKNVSAQEIHYSKIEDIEIRFREPYEITYIDVSTEPDTYSMKKDGTKNWMEFRIANRTFGLYYQGGNVLLETYTKPIITDGNSLNITPLEKDEILMKTNAWTKGGTVPYLHKFYTSNYDAWEGKDAYVGMSITNDFGEKTYGWLRVRDDSNTLTLIEMAHYTKPYGPFKTGAKNVSDLSDLDFGEVKWAKKYLVESPENDGGVNQILKVNLQNVEFQKTSGALELDADYSIENLPEGLISDFEILNNKTAVLKLKGFATSHSTANSRTVKITFKEQAFKNKKLDRILAHEHDLDLRFIQKEVIGFGSIRYTDHVPDIQSSFTSNNFQWIYFDEADRSFGTFATNSHRYELDFIYESTKAGTSKMVFLSGTNYPKEIPYKQMIGTGDHIPSEPADTERSAKLYHVDKFPDYMGKTIYVGISFEIEGETHYGWMQIGISTSDSGYPETTLMDMAYMTTPNTPIPAGIKTMSDMVPQVDFSVSKNEVSTGEEVLFNDLTVDEIISNEWSVYNEANEIVFTSDKASPKHRFNLPGKYTVKLKVTNKYGENKRSKLDLITVNLAKPIALIQGKNSIGLKTDDSKTFLSASYGKIDSYAWTVAKASAPENILASETDTDFSYTFPEEAEYKVSLKVSNSLGESTASLTAFVFDNLPEIPSALVLEGADIKVLKDKPLSLSNISTGLIEAYEWEVYKGTDLSGTVLKKLPNQDFTHIFDEIGTYTAKLKVGNVAGEDSTLVAIQVLDINAGFTANTTSACLGQSIDFTALETAENATYEWHFEGATPSVSLEKNPTVNYSTSGTFAVKLKVSKDGLFSEEEKIDFVTIASSLVQRDSIGFEEATSIDNWIVDNPDGLAYKWELNTSAGYQSSSALTMDNSANRQKGELDFITSESFDFSTAKDEMSFYVAYIKYDNNSPDTLALELSKDCGLTWTTVYKKGSIDLETTDEDVANPNNWIPSSDSDWRKEVIDISAFEGERSVKLRFKNISGFGTRIWVDHIEFKQTATQVPVANFTTTPEALAGEINIVAGESVTFTDASTNVPTSWSWKVASLEEGTNADFTHTFPNVGDYIVEFTASNSAGADSKSVTVQVTPVKHTITVNQPANGTISPETLKVEEGSSKEFTFNPEAGYELYSVLVDGDSVANASPYTLSDVQKAQTVSAVFRMIPPVEYTITVNQPENGTISPETATVEKGNSKEFTFNPETAYELHAIFVDGDSVANTSPYTLSDVQKAQTVSAVFRMIPPVEYTITVNQSVNGTISPETLKVEEGSSKEFTFNPETAYELHAIFVDGDSVANTSPYTLSDVQKDQTVSAVFRMIPPVEYTITVNQPVNGTISPATAIVEKGNSKEFTFNPETAYELHAIFVDGDSVANTSPYTLSDVQKAQTVSAVFRMIPPVEYTITVNQPANGSISPGTATVEKGNSKEFTFEAVLGYELHAIFVDGDSVSNTSPYVLSDVQKDQTVSAVFSMIPPVEYTITVTQPANGTISPETAVVESGNYQVFTFAANAGYELSDVKVDGVSQGNVSPFTLSDVQSNQSITAEFTAIVVAPEDQTLVISPIADIEVGETVQVTVNGNKTDLTYASSNPAFATVDENGLVTALAKGNVVITVTAESTDAYNEATETVSFKVTGEVVNPGFEIGISSESDKILTGVNVEFEGTGLEAGDKVVWGIFLNDTEVSSGSENFISFTAESIGTLRVELSVTRGDVRKRTSLEGILVEELSVILIDVTKTTFETGESYVFAAGAYTEGATLEWRVIKDGNSIPLSNPNGTSLNYKFAQEGSYEVKLNASIKNVQRTVSSGILTVEDRTPNRVDQTLVIASISNLEIDETANLNVSGDMTTLTYTSSNENVATVSTSGVITAIAEGTTIITVNAEATADYNAASSNISVTVNPAVVDPEDQTLVITSVPNLEIDETANLDVSGDMTSLAYASSDESVATVDLNGVVTAVAEGEVTITVTAERTEKYNEATEAVTINVTSNSVLSTNDFNLIVQAYPNPGNGVFNLTLPANYKTGTVEVLSLIGSSIRTFELRKGSYDLSDQTPGIYYLRVTVDGRVKVLKLRIK